MNINVTNITEVGILSVVVKIDEDEAHRVPFAHRIAVVSAMDALVIAAEEAEAARGEVSEPHE